jgi:hypothetical protein
MLYVRNSADMARALDPPIDVRLKRLLTMRRDQLLEHECSDLGDLAHWIIVAVGDPLASIEAEAGFSIAPNPPWEWVLDHDGIMEAPIILSDDGFGVVLIVPDEQGIDTVLLTLLRRDAVTADRSGDDAQAATDETH